MNQETKEEKLREFIRVLLRNMNVLEKNESTCCQVTLSQCHAIVEVGRVDKISLNQLATILNLDNSTMSRTINSLVKDGLVERETDDDDRRYVRIKLTNEGIAVFKNIEESMNMYFQKILKSIPEAKHQQVMESIDLLLEGVKKNKCC